MSVISVSISTDHEFSKTPQTSITLIQGRGVKGDCHAGETVQHRSRLNIRPAPPNLRQVHLIQSELFEEFASAGADGTTYQVAPGQLGENITTAELDLLSLSADTKLHFVPGDTKTIPEIAHAVVRITGLRNPCPQIDGFQKGLKDRCIIRDQRRSIVERKAGVMGVVEVGGLLQPGYRILVESPRSPQTLQCV
ncbi:MAG: hypothetical protein M1837_000103 [Sclerophora amabilis]|nr:MAG: hypothetical protein M1837_000103 [Sclerophora amabilis]